MRRALGKGLSQLLGEGAEASGIRTVPVSSIVPNPRQPRRTFDEAALAELQESIRTHGIIQPLVVRTIGEDRYELIAGERRLRASKLAGLESVPVVIRPESAQASLEIAIIENVQREDISPMEAAFAYRALMDEFNLTQEQVAQKVGKSRASIANTIRLLGLPAVIQAAIAEGTLSEGHARALLTADSEARRLRIFHKIQSEGLTVRQAEAMAREESNPRLPGAPKSEPKPKPTGAKDPNIKMLEAALSEFLGSIVRIQPDEVGGRIEIDYYSDDDLQRLLERIGFAD
ncbi:MAG: ParB/RepB/Spo0J family partition protein [Fimbriimonadaceae bacterium]|nr:ParB/RepB/Spo0J family partition protein [Fimbriimonadaceae bacterium]